MSTDRANDKQVNQDRTPVEITATGIATETEISDETLEAVAGGTPQESLNGLSESVDRLSIGSFSASLSGQTH